MEAGFWGAENAVISRVHRIIYSSIRKKERSCFIIAHPNVRVTLSFFRYTQKHWNNSAPRAFQLYVTYFFFLVQMTLLKILLLYHSTHNSLLRTFTLGMHIWFPMMVLNPITHPSWGKQIKWSTFADKAGTFLTQTGRNNVNPITNVVLDVT